ncbi:TRAP transporter substrate-binding protein DctP [Falsigemmobacter faecalis]|nr:TRAP transporter substrate-binding protein DctP [Falsigemmobacter faecalis]
MKQTRRSFTRTFAIGSALALAGWSQNPAPAEAQEVITWRLQAHLPTGSGSWNDSVVALSTRVAERSNGRLKISVHPADSLMASSEIFPAVARGVIEMGYSSPAYFQDQVPTGGLAFSIPGAFQSVWEATYFWKHLGFEALIREEAQAKGVHYFTDKLYPTELVLKEVPASLADLSKMRIRSAGALQRYLAGVGAAPVFAPGSEIYLALTTGVVDGAHWGAAQEANSLSLYEAAKFHMRPALGIGGVEAFIINEKAMAALPEDLRDILSQTLEENFWARTVEYQHQEEKMLRELAQSQGVTVAQLPQDVQDKMREAGKAFRAEEAARSPNAAEAVRRLEDFLAGMGR